MVMGVSRLSAGPWNWLKSAYLSTLSALLARFVKLETTSAPPALPPVIHSALNVVFVVLATTPAPCAPAETTQCVPTVQPVARESMSVLPAIPPVMHSAQAAQLALSPQHLGPAAALLVQLENSLSMGLVNVLTVVLVCMGLGLGCPRV